MIRVGCVTRRGPVNVNGRCVNGRVTRRVPTHVSGNIGYVASVGGRDVNSHIGRVTRRAPVKVDG